MPFLGVAFGLACLVTLGCGAGFDSTAFGAGATLHVSTGTTMKINILNVFP